METLENMNNVREALAAGASLGAPKAHDGKIGQFAVIPKDYQLHNLEKYALKPDRKRGTVVMHDADSFIHYFNKHATECAEIYAQIDPPKFVGVLNDHTKESAGWKDHKAIYDCPFSVEWIEWQKYDKEAMSQANFADFIERNLPDIVEPDGADMLEISRSLQAKKKVNFSSGIRLSNGQQELTYEEEISGTSAKGKLQIPETFKIGIAVLEGGDPYSVEARLRYRIQDARLVMWYELVRPTK